MTYDVDVGGRSASVSVRAADDGWWVAVDGGSEVHVRGQAAGAAGFWLDDGRRRLVSVRVCGDAVHAQIDGYGVSGTIVDPRDAGLAGLSGASEGAIRTPMPGAVVRLPVSGGASVQAGDVIAVVEAMKMENEFKSPIDGVLVEVHVAVGDAVEANTLLVTVEPA